MEPPSRLFLQGFPHPPHAAGLSSFLSPAGNPLPHALQFPSPPPPLKVMQCRAHHSSWQPGMMVALYSGMKL